MEAATALLLAQLTGANAPPVTATDPSSYGNRNLTSPTALTKSWALLPTTPVPGTVYTLDTEFTATWGAEQLALGVLIAGTFSLFSPYVAASAFSDTEILAGWLRLTVRVQTSSTARFAIYGAIAQAQNSTVPGTGIMPVALLSYTLGIAAADTVAIGCYFGASNASQGISTYGSTFTTIG